METLNIPPLLQWTIAFLVGIGSLFGFAKLAEIFVTRRFDRKDGTIEVKIANEGKAIEANGAFVKDILKRLSDVEISYKEVQAELLKQSVASARLEVENLNLQKENTRLQDQIQLLVLERNSLNIKVTNLENDYKNLQKQLNKIERES